ncbi:MAG TPA: Ig-like domain-containing protein, partial [Actinomycetota bacterium]|nr:Ig-like domain-containing protein [Actinomycetota bacterium]
MHVPPRRVRAALLAALALTALPAAAQAANRVPVCFGTTTAVAPDTGRAFSVRCNFEFDGPEPPRVEIVDQPDRGTLDLLGGLRVRYEPSAREGTEDSFTFRVTDGASQTAVLTQQIEITGENLAPRCVPLQVVANPPFGVELESPCYDPNAGDAVKPLLHPGTEPQHGTAFVGEEVGYGPDPGYQGPDTFSLKATDGRLTGPPTPMQVSVEPLTPPECDTPPTVPVRPDGVYRFRPLCRDNRGTSFTEHFQFRLVDEPSHGQVDTPGAGTFEYRPHDGYTGPDQFTVMASNLAGESAAPITVSVQVSEDANQAPHCLPFDAVRVRSGETVSLSAFCSDPDPDELETLLDPGPSHGALATGDGFRTYTADDDYTGRDDFALRFSDGRAISAPVPQPVDVVGGGENTLPDCVPLYDRVRYDRTTRFSLGCRDAEDDPVDFTWEQPEHGTVAEVVGGFPFGGTSLVYDPDDGFTGLELVEVTAEDSHGGVVPITHLVDVTAPEAPVCRDRPTAEVRPDRTLTLMPVCEADGAPVAATTVTDPPDHGTLQNHGGGHYTYTPAAGYTGPDSITFKAENAHGNDELVQEIEVTSSANHVPGCMFAGPSPPPWTREGDPVELDVECFDEENDALTLSTVDAPDHGDLGAWDQAEQRVVYTPDAGFVGVDTFTFKANDGRGDSPIVTVHIRVRAADANYAPRCSPAGAGTDPGEPVSFTPVCSDRDGDPVTLSIVEQPEHGAVTGPDGTGAFTYTPDDGFEGTDTVGIRASDGQASSPV